MAKKRIFIGSAKEKQEYADSLAGALGDKGYNPVRWWKIFPPGSITLDRLVEMSRSVDAAILILTAIDEAEFRGQKVLLPRDNLLLEYGLFVSQLGRRRTLILTDSEARLPTDTAGITWQKIEGDVESVAKKAVDHFNDVFSNPPERPRGKGITVVSDPAIVDIQLHGLPDSWHSRALYVGIEGAKGWLGVVNDPDYQPEHIRYRVTSDILDALESVEIRTLVSFGPGDGAIDEAVVDYLRNKEQWLSYIPVDINDFLLNKAASRVSEDVLIPIAILSDFEERLSFVRDRVNEHAVSPILYAMFGGTFGNLERYERDFLMPLMATMSSDDFLFLDVLVMGENWSPETERRCKHSGYGPPQRRFLCNGIAQRTGESIEQVIEQFEERVEFQEGLSDVPGAYTIRVVDKTLQPTYLITNIRRYKTDELLGWLETIGFKVKDKKIIPNESKTIGRGLIVLGKR